MGGERAPTFSSASPSDADQVLRSFLHPASRLERPAAGFDDVPGDGKPQAGSPEFAGPRLVDPVEPFDRNLLFLSSRPGGGLASSGESVRTANPVQTTP